MPTLSAEELPADPGYSRLKEYLIESTGLAYYADKDADLARRIHRRLAGFGVEDCGSYLRLLRDDVRGAAEMDALIAEVMISETYFFRHREHFDALRDVVLPDLARRNATSRQMRIWCAGCADGAEPYTLSILLRRELADWTAGWDIPILSTDINRQALASASEGKFEAWSLRATSESVKRACFEEKGKQWLLAPEYRAGVSFQAHNLADDAFPPLCEMQEFDLIVCRNVMIYFDPELMRRIILQFHGCLAPGGWLLVGPSEPNMTHFASFRAVNAPGVTLYQKPAEPYQKPLEPAPDFAAWVAPARVFAPPVPVLPPALAPVRAPAPAPVAKDVKSSLTLAELRRHADTGDWEKAVSSGRHLIAADNLNPDVHFHYALVLEQTGDYAEAERSLRRAIYLNRKWAPAHYHLGTLLRSRGHLREASRCFGNAITALAAQPGEAIVAGGDGITVAELRRLTQMQLQSLKEHS